MLQSDQHIYHHNITPPARVNVSVERNTKGYSWTATVINAATVAEALALLTEAENALRAQFGEKKQETTAP